MRNGTISIRIVKEPYRIDKQDQCHYFLCELVEEPVVGCRTLRTVQLNANEISRIIEISTTAFYKRLNKWGWESPNLYTVKKAVTLTSKDDIGNDAWKALSDKSRVKNLDRISDGREGEIFKREHITVA